MKTEGELAVNARRWAQYLLLAVLVIMVIVSLWTPLAFERIADRWFTWPNILYLSPVPVLTALAAFGLTQVFSGRGAFIMVGAMLGTIMVANVFRVIIPNQRKVVAAMLEGRTPDPMLGRRGKQRSLHNNYITLPVLFTMISNHYPVTFAPAWNWLILAALGAIGIAVRSDDARMAELVAALDHAPTHKAIVAERAMLAVLDGSCRTPIGGHAVVSNDRLQLRGMIIRPDGSEAHETAREGSIRDAATLGADAGRELKSKGGADFFKAS